MESIYLIIICAIQFFITFFRAFSPTALNYFFHVFLPFKHYAGLELIWRGLKICPPYTIWQLTN